MAGVIRLLEAGADRHRLADHLYALETTSMGLPGERDRCERAADRLLDIALDP